MATKKPLVEAMAQAYVAEAHRLDPHNASWADLPIEEQNMVLLCMTEVARTVGYFERRGMAVLLLPEEKPETREVQISPTSLGAPEPTDEVARKAKVMGYTGIPCDQCGSLNTVRIGKCLQCQTCFFNGECG